MDKHKVAELVAAVARKIILAIYEINLREVIQGVAIVLLAAAILQMLHGGSPK